jgi:hypothetical protein
MHIKDNKGHKEHHHASHESLTKGEIEQVDKVVEESVKHARHHEHELKAEFDEANKVNAVISNLSRLIIKRGRLSERLSSRKL